MLSSDEGDIDVFYDSFDYLPSQEPVLASEEFGSYTFDHELWVNDPQCVEKRRHSFLQKMGLAVNSSKICSQEKIMSFCSSSDSLGLDRIRDCGGAVSSASISPTEKIPTFDVVFHELKERPGDKVDASFQGMLCGFDSVGQKIIRREPEAQVKSWDFDMDKRKRKTWWKRLINSWKGGGDNARSKLNSGTNGSRRIKVKHNKKKWMEFSALYIGQEIRAHKGLIRTMKFNPSGQYLASGGGDGVIRIWRVMPQDISCSCFTAEDSLVSTVKKDLSCSLQKQSSQSPTALPNKVFKIEELPLHEFYGHSSDVLDLAWSNSDILLSSSMDKTVRLWKIGCDECLNVFHHNDYVTCIQFNPVHENYFISGSIDGKVRIWGIFEERVVDWADVRDVITAVSFKPDGKGFVVGSLTGICRSYVASGEHFQLEAETRVCRKMKTSSSKITSIQFSQENHQRVMITSEDNKLRILDRTDLVQKFKGFSKSGSQMSASFTSSEKHIISVGEDSRVYIWNSNDLDYISSKHPKSERSCEYFFSEGVTVALPWSGMSTEQRDSRNIYAHCSEMQQNTEGSPWDRDPERFSLGNWFSIDGTCRGSMTWPEEKLPIWNLSFAEDGCYHQDDHHDHQQQLLCHTDFRQHRPPSDTWGLSIVTAGCDGTIKTCHNFGLPVRL